MKRTFASACVVLLLLASWLSAKDIEPRRGWVTGEHAEKAVAYAKKKGFKEIYACIAKWNDPELRVIRSLKFQSKDLGYRYRLSLKLGEAKSAASGGEKK